MPGDAIMRAKPHILVFQHIAIEHPGIFRDCLREDGVAWTAVELDDGAVIPELSDYDGLWVMGGPMDVWEEAKHPWLEQEKIAIREAVLERQLPYLGVCLGHQLLADTLGGEVGPSQTPEIGVLEVEATRFGQASPYLQGLPAVTKGDFDAKAGAHMDNFNHNARRLYRNWMSVAFGERVQGNE